MPAFWSRQSPFRAPLTLDSAEAIAHLSRTRAGARAGWRHAGRQSGAARPTKSRPTKWPSTSRRRRRRPRRSNITGKAVTPFLLDKLLELTGGRSLKTNIALVENNARLAAEIAKAL